MNDVALCVPLNPQRAAQMAVIEVHHVELPGHVVGVREDVGVVIRVEIGGRSRCVCFGGIGDETVVDGLVDRRAHDRGVETGTVNVVHHHLDGVAGVQRLGRKFIRGVYVAGRVTL